MLCLVYLLYYFVLVFQLYEQSGEQRTQLVASRFAMAHNMNPLQRSFVSVLQDGIDYATVDAPENLSFLRCGLLPYLTRASRKDATVA